MSGLGVFIFIAFVLIAIGLHEFGHFATAKAFGIKVEKFFIGFGPKLWSTHRGETEYGVSAFPLGGYVRIAGMNPLEEISPEDRPRTFKAKPPWQRAIVLAAGSFTHFIVALVIIAAILAIAGEIDPDRPTLELSKVGSESSEIAPAERAGLKPGDRIVAIAGRRVTRWSQVQDVIRTRPNQSIEIVVEREGRTLTRTATLDECARLPDGSIDCASPDRGERTGFLGVSPRYAVIHRSLPAAIGRAGYEVGKGMKDSVIAFGKVFTPSTLGRLFQVAVGEEQRQPEDPTTIVGVGKTAGDLARTGDFAGLFLIVAVFNVFVGVVNLLPLPPLDGGHLAVLTYEKIARRDVDMRRLLPITAMVLTVFGMLFVLLLYSDIVNPLPSVPG